MSTVRGTGDGGRGPREKRPWKTRAEDVALAGSQLLLVAIVIAVFALLLILPRTELPDPVVVVAVNPGPDTVLVDARWWGGPVGIQGPIARLIGPESRTVLFRARVRADVCVRVIEPRSRRLAAGLVADTLQNGDTVEVVVAEPLSGEPRPGLVEACPQRLEGDRVRVATGRYFNPDEPDRMRRERFIRRR